MMTYFLRADHPLRILSCFNSIEVEINQQFSSLLELLSNVEVLRADCYSFCQLLNMLKSEAKNYCSDGSVTEAMIQIGGMMATS